MGSRGAVALGTKLRVGAARGSRPLPGEGAEGEEFDCEVEGRLGVQRGFRGLVFSLFLVLRPSPFSS